MLDKFSGKETKMKNGSMKFAYWKRLTYSHIISLDQKGKKVHFNIFDINCFRIQRKQFHLDKHFMLIKEVECYKPCTCSY